ncbi:NAD P-binding protein [Gloeophyllum trabeum ATCC 11539]|uniref:Arsenite methyltransferase n=1 Tax=Gloeophyllum trabeum (strain ATCC 11539 / FP-39264 / Madison 617) TaxID=670483 RepID=S7Q4B7_GLOTA|nr:NAD P-binding protein [Gloeophyllum trabeum ATCC 11539]EPQ54352.1 NAD P-binding protein [Gloeophyllum trabeum ATCC 11539]
MAPSDQVLLETVQEAYSAKAREGVDSKYANTVAAAFGYSADELRSIPAEANLGLSCGNPVAAATIKEGESVIDLGSGGGIDVFLAASKVGPKGQVIGLDMSADMISLARRNAAKQGLQPPQVSFVQASLTEALPIISDSIDCILSNCVINLLPNSGKVALMKEAARVLKPGGRIVFHDIIAKRPLPQDIVNDLSAHVGCIAGAITLGEYAEMLNEAGLQNALFVDSKADINIYTQMESDTAGCTTAGCCAKPVSASGRPKFDANAWVASYQIYALKPRGQAEPTAKDSPTTALQRWWDAFPPPRSDVPEISAEELASLMRQGEKREFSVIDVRRDDYQGGHIRGSHQWPAQTFWNELPKFVDTFGRTPRVIFYCGSSNGRGPRCAKWYQDRLNEAGIQTSSAWLLKGGLKAWMELYGDSKELTAAKSDV